MAPASKHEDCPFKDIVFDKPAVAAEPDHRMDTRVGRLEGVVESLTRDIQEVSQNISMMGKEMGSFREMIGDTLTRMREGFTAQIESVTDRLTTSAKPQWQSIFAFVAMGLTVLGMAGAVVGMLFSGQAANVNRLQNDTAIITERMFSAQYEKGKADAFAAETSSHLIKLDTTLQREMTLMQQTTDSKITAVDNNVNSYIDKVQDALKDFRAWRLEHATEGAKIDASLTAKQEVVLEKLRNLENKMDNQKQK
jgi:hypothetical protein